MKGFNYGLIPEHLMIQITFYIERGTPMCHFLEYVFCNDLFKAMSFADDEAVEVLQTIVCYIYNKAPMSCHGSRRHYNEWIDKFRIND